MSYGKDERDIDKDVWKLPIPLYDATVEEHRALAALALSEDVHFATARRAVHEALEASEVGQEIEARVAALLK